MDIRSNSKSSGRSILLNRWNALWHPERYHGWGRQQGYFEGWYFKCVSADAGEALAFIPGIAMDKQGRQHAFIQIMDGKRLEAFYYPFEASAFQAFPDRFEIRIANTVFSDQRMVLNLPEVKGELTFHNLTPWPKQLGAPGIMGWYSFVPFMQCNHGVVSLNHSLSGSLEFKNRLVDFSAGKGYIEKDWGSSFPKAYVWLQTNHFEKNPDVSLMASVAHIPWLGTYFIGFICGFWLGGKLYRFATYTGAKKQIRLGDNQAYIEFKDKRYELRLLARQARGAVLISPLSGEMTGKVNESLQAVVEVELWENGRCIFSDTGRHAGLEIAGEVEVLLN